MTKESLLMQYQSECRNALESVVNISKSFQKVFMDAIKLFMAIPDRSCKYKQIFSESIHGCNEIIHGYT